MTVSTNSTGKTLPPGIYCPTVTFFKPTREQELDIETHVKHMEFLAKAGLDGVVLQGSTGEAVALNREEKKELIRTARDAFIRCGNHGAIIAGTVGAQSTREAIQLARDGAEAGADFALALPPSYFPGHMSNDACQAFFEELADASPIPIIIYSYPGVSSGIQLSSELTMKLAKHPNIAGIKHTDHDIGRIAREASVKSYGSPYTILGGATDYLLGTVAVGGHGAITGMTNVAPRAVAKVYELASSGRSAEALELAGLISRAEWSLGKGGLLGTKWATVWSCHYPEAAALARRPLPTVSAETKKHVEAECAELVEIERSLEKQGYVGSGLQTKAKQDVSATKTNGLLHTVKQKIAEL
ncbi:hypothetical protein BD324DRAFT_653899 [Kockovaella imperatae]|uniref:Dihydrodipicolinate synthetase n=1 Tax=Kockovaella imperatae TaxID=4999 RepID=A0A1Y1U740_9TREE|nr:hypothetical protein BD324DRAFT_653899 [Kockovaella imperatae]ORX33850.1 hypothetical protein BD324DRAFT_653899 [Kockovaella imperatae]